MILVATMMVMVVLLPVAVVTMVTTILLPVAVATVMMMVMVVVMVVFVVVMLIALRSLNNSNCVRRGGARADGDRPPFPKGRGARCRGHVQTGSILGCCPVYFCISEVPPMLSSQSCFNCRISRQVCHVWPPGFHLFKVESVGAHRAIHGIFLKLLEVSSQLLLEHQRGLVVRLVVKIIISSLAGSDLLLRSLSLRPSLSRMRVDHSVTLSSAHLGSVWLHPIISRIIRLRWRAQLRDIVNRQTEISWHMDKTCIVLEGNLNHEVIVRRYRQVVRERQRQETIALRKDIGWRDRRGTQIRRVEDSILLAIRRLNSDPEPWSRLARVHHREVTKTQRRCHNVHASRQVWSVHAHDRGLV
mmetsp:Transcript_78154/g.143731  ORF Transcript_78154/g.143731 Transcript_78154/m.143731 type:complete len:358 (-) Transcript_78154:1183-2256(-)